MEVIKFNDFMDGSYSLASSFPVLDFSFMSLETAYWIVGGTGAVLIGLTWMEKKGWISLNDHAVKVSLILIYAAIIGKYILGGHLWGWIIW